MNASHLRLTCVSPSQNSWFLKALGGLTIVALEGPTPTGAATQRRRLALLAVLATNARAGITREKLISLFWPDVPEERARAALTQALYALRQALGSDEVLLGATSLRLNESVLRSDVGQFRVAVDEGRLADAAGLWTGSFLDGVELPDADEFERWADAERQVLNREAVEVFERLAREAEGAGDHSHAVSWWQRRATVDPLAVAGAVGLMEAFAAAGDRAAALRHARVYEALVRDQLQMAPSTTVMALAARLREQTGAFQVPADTSGETPGVPALGSDDVAVPPTLSPPGRLSIGGWTRTLTRVGLALFVLGMLGWLALRWERGVATPTVDLPVIAVGGFGAYDPDLALMARSLTDMFATNLAQVPKLNVISSARIYELVSRVEGDTLGAFMSAARAAGATELIDGAIYRGSNGVRLDLRRTNLATGEFLHAFTVTGHDVFSAVDNGTAKLLEQFGESMAPRSIAEVSTKSAVAYRLYVEGLRSLYENQRSAAFRLFNSALVEDSTFAMAAYYAALSGEGSRPQKLERLGRAVRLAEGAGDRERLLIQWQWADEMDHPARSALAETLVTRYGAEPFAHLQYGRALVPQGRYTEALAAFRATIRLDRSGEVALAPGRCIACEARGELIYLLRALDSLSVAEREVRQAIQIEGSSGAWLALAELLASEGRWKEADEVYERVGGMTDQHDIPLWRAIAGIRQGTFEAVDGELLSRLGRGPVETRGNAEWWLAFSYRAQGRLADAAELARNMRDRDSTWGQRAAAPYLATVSGAVLFEQGRYLASAAVFDSIAQLRTPGEVPSRLARHRVWFMTLASAGLAAAGDTAGLAARADTIEMLGRQSAYIRDQRLHHHVRGLLYSARGWHHEAIEAGRRAILMPAVGYGRTQFMMARSLRVLGRYDEAIALLQPLLAGPIDGPNSYLLFTDIHELLAELHAEAGNRDRSIEHARWVVNAWRRADASFGDRRRRMEALTENRGA